MHHYTLARLAGAAADHPFRRTLAVFASGRWPIELGARRLVLF